MQRIIYHRSCLNVRLVDLSIVWLSLGQLFINVISVLLTYSAVGMPYYLLHEKMDSILVTINFHLFIHWINIHWISTVWKIASKSTFDIFRENKRIEKIPKRKMIEIIMGFSRKSIKGQQLGWWWEVTFDLHYSNPFVKPFLSACQLLTFGVVHDSYLKIIFAYN